MPASETVSLAALERTKRATIRSINSIKGEVDSALQEQPSEDLTCKIRALLISFESLLKELHEIDIDILDSLEDNQSDNLEREEAAVTAEHTSKLLAYSLAEGKLAAMKTRLSHSTEPTNSRHSMNATISNEERPTIPRVKLPDIPIPKFDGNIAKYTEWRSLFAAMIDANENLKDVQKLYYLKQAMVGGAANLLADYSIEEGLYQQAWQFVNERYFNKRAIISEHFRNLLDMPAITHATLRESLDKTSAIIRGLNICDIDTAKMSPIIAYIFTRKLPEKLRIDWENSNFDHSSYPSFTSLSTFLRNRCFAYEALQSEAVTKPQSQTKSAPTKQKATFVTTAPVKSTPTQCISCGEQHFISQCPSLLEKTMADRYAYVREKRLCVNCLRYGHQAKECNSSKCRKCGKNHNTLLHRDHSLPSNTSTSAEQSSSNEFLATKKTVNALAAHSPLEVILLPSAVVHVLVRGSLVPARLLLDPCSQANLVSEGFVRTNRIPSSKGHSSTLFSVSSLPFNSDTSASLKLKSRFSSFQVEIEADIVGRIPYDVPTDLVKKVQEIGHGFQLADSPLPNETITRIDILIGGQHANQFLLGRKKFFGQLCFKETVFGWVAEGPLSRTPMLDTRCCHLTTRVEETLAKFWETEEVEVSKAHFNEHEMCVSHFDATHSRLSDGRFQIRLPLKRSVNDLADTFSQARAALTRSEMKLSSDIRLMYVDFMKEYIELGHMELVPTTCATRYLIPHLPVFRPERTTTKLRVVFNASAKNGSGIALNEALMVGPSIQPELFDILLKFRTYPVAFTADISKMYRQVSVHPEDRHLQTILWRNSPQEKLEKFQLTTLTYGTSPASFVATKCLEKVAFSLPPEKSDVAEAITSGFYMDDLLTGACSATEAIQKAEAIRKALLTAGFPLRKFVSNAPELLTSLDPELVESLRTVEFSSSEGAKILGLQWLPSTDELLVSSKLVSIENITLTKRIIASLAAQLYDPLGLVSPVLIRAKILLQDLWREGKGWDDPTSPELSERFRSYYADVRSLSSFRIPRPYSNIPFNKVKIIAFCDASQRAYGAVLYVRSESPNSKFHINLMCAKSKVAPLKAITIPWLELLAAVLLAKLVSRVLKVFQIDVSKVYAFSDSTIVLAWLQGSSSRLKEFVRNRVDCVNERVPRDRWSYINTSENPADLLSRGTSVDSLVKSNLWKQGPSWLKNQSIRKNEAPVPESLPEQLSFKVVNAHTTGVIFNEQYFERFSDFDLMIRVTSQIYKFLFQGRSSFTKYAALESRDRSLYMLCHITQSTFFQAEIAAIVNNEPLPRRSSLMSLNPFVDSHGILRVGGRLQNSFLSYDQKHPVILHRRSKFVLILVRYIHERYYHATHAFVLAHLRSHFWIVGGAPRVIKKVIYKCVWCTRMKGDTKAQLMGNLPIDRVTVSRPFSSTGVDYAGPLAVKCTNHRTMKYLKYYVVFFVCCVTRAVHLELAEDLTTTTFIAALQRFSARRGVPGRIRSDNATNFVGAKNEISKYCEDIGINFQFIPPRSPHHGGLWESAVKAGKKYLLSATKGMVCNVQQFSTILAQVEAILNSRPLYCKRGAVSEVTDIITPGHFLVSSDLLEPTPPDNISMSLVERLEHQRIIIRSFWTQWSKNYIAQLQPRSKWRSTTTNIQVGAIVLLRDENTPPLKWPLARIEEVHPDDHGNVRVVTVSTGGSKFRRAVQKLVPLPIE